MSELTATETQTALRLSTGEQVAVLSGPHPDPWGAYYTVRTTEGTENLRAEWLQ